MFPLITFTVLEAILHGVASLEERLINMEEQLKDELEQIKANQVATSNLSPR